MCSFVKVIINKTCKNHKLLSVTEFIFCNNPKPMEKLLLGSSLLVLLQLLSWWYAVIKKTNHLWGIFQWIAVMLHPSFPSQDNSDPYHFTLYITLSSLLLTPSSSSMCQHREVFWCSYNFNILSSHISVSSCTWIQHQIFRPPCRPEN